jgi:predicted GTPase
VFRDDPETRVMAFTAAQIPGIADRTYPPSLAGAFYPQGIPILPEEDLPAIVREHGVDEVVLAYSDLSHEEGMHKASLVLATGEEPVRQGMVMYAGVDYRAILEQAQAEADVVVWDGGNHDFPLFVPDLLITVADPLRPGHDCATTRARPTCAWPTWWW